MGQPIMRRRPARAAPESRFAVRFDGTIYDCGGRIGFLAANIAYAMDRAELAAPLRIELERLLGKI